MSNSSSETNHLSLPSPWAASAADVAGQLEVDSHVGLSSEEAARRLAKYGPNLLHEVSARSPVTMFFSQFVDLMIALLIVAALISAAIGEWADTILIAIIVLANASIGAVQEWRAEKAVAALRKLSQPTARVRRGGRLNELPALNVVLGDVIEVKSGDFIPADARLVDAAELQTSESALTGESLPNEKSPETLAAETPLPDRSCMLYAGTAVTQGHARALVTGTGMTTELGKIAILLQETETVQTPLQQRLAALSKRLAIVVVAISILIFVAGVLRVDRSEWDRDLFSVMLLTAVSLAVAAIPEGLPAVITISLALGSQKMSRRKAIVRRLSAVETLGSVDVICSDKTGTLTQNRMVVADLIPVVDSEKSLVDLLRAGVLCNDADLSPSGEILGTATEAAIL